MLAAAAFGIGTDVVLTGSDALAAEDGVQVGTLARASPAFNDGEHGLMDFAVGLASGGMVEHTDDIIEDLVQGNIGVLPGVENARGYVRKDSGGNLACRLVKYVGEVVFGKQRVCWVRAVRVCPRLVLVSSACVNHRGTACFELSRDGVDDGADEGGQKGEHKEGKTLSDLFDESFQTRNLLDSGGYSFRNFISEFEDGIYLCGGLNGIEAGTHSGNTWTWRSTLGAGRSGELCINMGRGSSCRNVPMTGNSLFLGI